MNSPKRILVSANDPGGANSIVPVVRALKARGNTVECVVTGPAVEIFSSGGILVDDVTSITENELRERVEHLHPSVFLAGTSIGNSIDKRIFRSLRECPSVYVIDFWSHYGHRFSQPQSDLSHLPTRICVIDERMRDEMISEGFPTDRLFITGNPHFEHFAEHITREREDRSRVVFISQPIRRDVGEGALLGAMLDEYHVLERVLEVLPAHLRLSIRLHPREDAHKYDTYLNERVEIDTEQTLEDALSKAGLVVGMFSPVLMQAALAGKPAISYQSGQIEEDPLPTNALGITKRVESNSELIRWIQSYERGEILPKSAVGLFPAGATERVVEVIDELLSK